MKKHKLLLIVTPMLAVLLFAFVFGGRFLKNSKTDESALPWVKIIMHKSNKVDFSAVATDSDGNIYAAGSQFGNEDFTYGSKKVKGNFDEGTNAVLVKYDKNGNALWARSTTKASSGSVFNAVAVDSTGNIYAAGYYGNGYLNFGGISKDIQGNFINNERTNSIIVKYDKTGKALWARSTITASRSSSFTTVATDLEGNVYAAGDQQGDGDFDYGCGNINGAYGGKDAYGSDNAILVKYDKDGKALWARSTIEASSNSSFTAITTDSTGNIYVAGRQFGGDYLNFGTFEDVIENFKDGRNAFLVKYDKDGEALWARSTTKALNESYFNAIAIDSAGNIYAAGGQYRFEEKSEDEDGCEDMDYRTNAILVKYIE